MPNWNHIVRQHLAALRLPPEREIEIVEELALCFEAVYEDALAAGLSEAEAEARAVRGYDWQLLECELSRAERPQGAQAWRPSLELIERTGGMRMESFIQDLRFGARMLLKQPGFTLIAALTLALGIGAKTAIFSVVNAALLRPLPYKEPDRLVTILEMKLPQFRESTASPGNFLDWKKQNTVFERLVAYLTPPFNLVGTGDPEQLRGMKVTDGFFAMLGAQPLLGRDFLPEEDQPGRNSLLAFSGASNPALRWNRRARR